MNRLAFYVLIIVACCAAHVIAFPQKNVLKEKEEQHAELIKAQEQARLRKDSADRQYRALQEDPEYLELISRDVLDYYKPGEIIFEVAE